MSEASRHPNCHCATGDELTARARCSYRYDLAATPTLTRLQQILFDLYAQRRLEPQYLFLAEPDRQTLTHEVLLDARMSSLTYTSLDELNVQLGLRTINYIANPVTGARVLVVPLPGLESGSVIAGFFH